MLCAVTSPWLRRVTTVPQLLDRLNALALRGHRVLYTRQTEFWQSFVRFVAYGFPRRVRAEWRTVGLATLCFLIPALVVFFTVLIRPDLIYSVLSWAQVNDFEAMYDPAAKHIGSNRDASSDVEMFGFYVANNIGIAFRCFAWGLFLGFGSAFVLAFNGLLLGAVSAHMLHVGFESTFFSFVIAHGALELTAIVLSGAAGMRLGYAVLAPGTLSRLESLRLAALEAVELVYGILLMLLLASVIEAFWSSKGTVPVELKLAVGGVLWALVLAYFLWAGRGRRMPTESTHGP